MGYVIAIAGKGGTGKTTIAALLVRLLSEQKKGAVLAVDADPNSNLAEVLGVKSDASIGKILEEVSAHPEKIPQGIPKDRFIEYRVQTIIQETEGFDVLSMGRPEGPGCYCYVNNVLRGILTKLIGDYKYVVIDNEAGLEHLSRRTTRYADALIIVSDASHVGLRAAERISVIVKELGIKTKKNLLIVNCFDGELERRGQFDLEVDYLGNIPRDELITKISMNGNSLMKLNANAVSIGILRKMGDKIWD